LDCPAFIFQPYTPTSFRSSLHPQAVAAPAATLPRVVTDECRFCTTYYRIQVRTAATKSRAHWSLSFCGESLSAPGAAGTPPNSASAIVALHENNFVLVPSASLRLTKDRFSTLPGTFVPSCVFNHTTDDIVQEAASMIRKLKSGGYRLYSRKINPKTGKRRNLGTFATRAAAEKHERAVQYFKRH
jgi:hypothetical protein